MHNKYDVLVNYENFDECITPGVLANGIIMPFLTFEKEWELGNVYDYINDSMSIDIINKKENVLKKTYNIALTRDIFDIQEIIQEIIYK